MAINQDDWEMLNAYLDGELSDNASEAFKNRLSQDLVLSDKLVEISTLKQSLSGLHLKHTPTTAISKNMGWIKHAVAASLIFLVGTVAFFLNDFQQTRALSPAVIHTAYSEKAYILSNAPQPVKVSGNKIGDFYIPDLTASELQLADTQFEKAGNIEIVSAHFRGMRGCRLTFIGESGPVADALVQEIRFILGQPDKLLKATWQSGGSQFTLLASAMDRNRFQAIARYVQNDLKREHNEQREELRMAMRSSYELARPCA